MASDPESGPRPTGRHAAPRLTVRGRLRLPVGRAIALTAVPTALLMGTIAPKFALAADATPSSASATSHDHATDASSAPTGSDCTKTSISSLIAGAAKTGSGTTTSTRSASATTGGDSSGSRSSGSRSTGDRSTGAAPAKSSAGSVAPSPTRSAAPSSGTPSQAPSSTPTAGPTSAPTSGSSGSSSGGGLGAILNGLGGLLGLDAEPARSTATPTPSASASASAAPAARQADITNPVSVLPSASASHSAPAASATPSSAPSSSTGPTRSAGSSADPSAAGTPATSPATSGTTSAEANRACDISRLAAPMDTSMPPGEMPTVPWTLKSTSLELINTQFWGVVTVPTAAGDVRVLKFTAQEVNIGDLDMSTQQIGQELHVQGGPGTTSTMRGGTVTMYVTSLSGTLAEAEGIPLAWLGVNLTLTPDTLPQWLYDLIGSVPIPLTLTLNNAVATQTGQFGGNLTIPGMHLFYTPLS